MHTPGPWEVVERTEVQSGPIDCLAYVSTAGARGRSLGEAMANARLIAASPDLLAACQQAIQFLNAHPSGPAIPVATALNRAIARATGDNPE